MPRSRWQPILVGDLAEQAWSAIRDVARAIGEGAGLDRSATDLAVFWAYVAGALDDEWSAARYDEACTELCASVSTARGLALHGGLAGMAWVLAHIGEDGSADELLADVDDVILGALDVEPWTHDYDLMRGLVGYGVYFVERARSSEAAAAVQGLRRIVEHLIATSEATEEGRAWHTAPALLPAWQREVAPHGYFNCGLAHGVPGVIALLGHIAELDCDPRARSLCDEAMRWMRAQQIVDDPRGRYPTFRVRDERPRRAARTAWCYGDPGIAISGWSAAARLGRPIDEWRELARIAATRDPELCGVVDPGVCHGSAGLAHMYNRCYQASGDDVFRDAARAWFQRTLELRRPDGLAGFSAWSRERWRPAASIVEGATGVALALLAALQPVEPSWDRLLLCDVPRRPGGRTAHAPHGAD